MADNRYKVKTLKRHNGPSASGPPGKVKRIQTFEDLL